MHTDNGSDQNYEADANELQFNTDADGRSGGTHSLAFFSG